MIFGTNNFDVSKQDGYSDDDIKLQWLPGVIPVTFQKDVHLHTFMLDDLTVEETIQALTTGFKMIL